MRQCRAKSKRSKKRCQNPAMKGMEVCYHHGGKLGNRKAKEARRQAVFKHGQYTQEALLHRKQLSLFIKGVKEFLKKTS